jgi:hypothetical protein
MTTANCVICGTEFEKTRPDRMCCSGRCSTKNSNRKNPPKQVKRKYKPVDYPERQCAVCSATFKPKQERSRFCSRECDKQAREHQYARIPVDHPEKPCEMCGDQFKPRHFDTKFCMPCRKKRAHIRGEAKRVGTVRAYRNTPEQTRKKRLAHRLAKQIVVETMCEVCGGNNKLHRHHDDYNKPLQVRILCQKCHRRWHCFNVAVC